MPKKQLSTEQNAYLQIVFHIFHIFIPPKTQYNVCFIINVCFSYRHRPGADRIDSKTLCWQKAI